MFNWNPETRINGTSLQGYYTPKAGWSFEETVARLTTLSGQNPSEAFDGDGKVTVEFVGTFDGAVFTLYDYYADRRIHIGGHGDGWGTPAVNVAALAAALDDALAPVPRAPYTADGHSWPVR